VLDGSDAVMLSEETAVGRYPVEAVRVMERILGQAEPLLTPRLDPGGRGVPDRITRAACEMAQQIGAGAIVVPTLSGFTARMVARHRPSVPIVALVPDAAVRRRLSLGWGVTAVAVPTVADGKTLLEGLAGTVRATGLLPAGSTVVVTAGLPFGTPGGTNLLHVTTV
jgi:pyruvate kinase